MIIIIGRVSEPLGGVQKPQRSLFPNFAHTKKKKIQTEGSDPINKPAILNQQPPAKIQTVHYMD